MKLTKENEKRYWDLVHGLIDQIIRRVEEEPGKSLDVTIPLTTARITITRIYIDEKGFPCIRLENENDFQYFDIFTINELLTIVNQI